MSRFNTTIAPAKPDTLNKSGGEAFVQDAETALASLVCTNFVTDQYYRSADESLDELRSLIGRVDPKFAAKAAIYARNSDGMRSITHALAGEIAYNVKGEEWTKEFFDRVVRRPDDTTEILAYYMGRYGKPLPNALKKGLGKALGKFDEYQLAKYRGEGKGVSLVDVVNLTHAKPTAKNAEALRKLVEGTLRSEKTWEAKISAAGKSEDKQQAKAEAWRELVESKEIGHFALLRNLRNIAEQAPELVDAACELLVDENRIRKSLILPFRFATAYNELSTYPKIRAALSDALDISLANVPEFDNATVWVDLSGSMGSPAAGSKYMTCAEVGSLFAAILFKKSGGAIEVGAFGSNCEFVKGINPRDSTITIAYNIRNTNVGHATNFAGIFDCLTKNYDDIIIFSDMQANITSNRAEYYHDIYGTNAAPTYNAYKKRVKANPNVFAFDLSGYGTSQLSGGKVHQLAGFSDATFKVLDSLRTDPQAFVKAIKAIQL